MKTYRTTITRHYHATVQANNETEAEELFKTGEGKEIIDYSEVGVIDEEE